MKDETTFFLLKAKELFARKYIRPLGETAWSATGIVTPSLGQFEYRLSLINNLDKPRAHIDIVDFFPYVGDVSIQEENIGNGVRPARESQFMNTYDLSRLVQVPAGYQVTYWNSATIIDYEGKSADDVIAGLTWSATPDATTRGIRITALEGTVLAPGDRLDVIVPMQAPANDTSNDFQHTGQRAFNTFVRKDSATIRFLEPNRVYNTLLPPLGSIQFTKWAQDTIVMDPPAPQYVLEGAEFELRDSLGNFVAKAISDVNGLVYFGDLPIFETYTIREIQAPAGFLDNPESRTVSYDDFKTAYNPATFTFDVVLTDEQSKETFLNIKPIIGSLTLQKLNGLNSPLQYIRFNLMGLNEWNKDFNHNYLTDANGYIRVPNLLMGRYRLTELVPDGSTGFIAVAPIEFTINADKKDFVFATEEGGGNPIINANVRVLISKLAVGHEFDVLASIRDLIDFGVKKLDGYSFTITEVGTSNSFVTGPTVNGSVVLDNLEIGKLYEITEVRKDGTIYQHNAQAYRFMLNGEGKLVDENGVPFRQNQLNFPNPKKAMQGRVRVVKTDDDGNPLAGAVFALFKDGVEIFRGTTELVNGIAELVFGDLDPGTYVLAEILAPPGYVHSLVEYTFTVPEEPDESMMYNSHYTIDETVVIREFERIYKNTIFDVEVIKGDEVLTNIPLAAAQAYVASHPEYRYRVTGNGLASVYKPLEGVVFTLYKLGFLNIRLNQGQFMTDAEGRIDFGDYKFEEDTRYELVETQTIPGYRLDPTPIAIDTGFEAAIQGFDGTIKRYKNNAPIAGRIIVSKYDEDDRVVLAGVTFALYYANDVNFENPLQTMVTNSSGVLEFRDLQLGYYRVKEIEVPAGYQLRNLVFDVALTDTSASAFLVVYNPQLVEFDVVKQWVIAPKESVTIWITANGGDAYDVDGNKLGPVDLMDSNGWRATFSRLPKYDDANNLIVYEVHEKTVDGYSTMVLGNSEVGFTVVNTEIPLTSIGVTKVWQGTPAPQVTVYLLANNVRTGQSVILNAGNRWQHVFGNLPSTENGVAITYSVEEEPIPGYETRITGTAETGFVITNIEEPKAEEIPISVRKVWEGNPTNSVTVHLLANGNKTGKSVVLNEANQWKHTFTGLPVDLNGVPIVYSILEDAVNGYTTTYSGDLDTGFVVTNIAVPPVSTPQVSATPTATPTPTAGPTTTGTPAPTTTPTGKIPFTGDSGLIYWLAGAALLSLSGFFVLNFLGKRRK